MHNLSNILLTLLLATFLSPALAGAIKRTVFSPAADKVSEVQKNIQPDPNLSPVEVVRIQIEALGKNNIPHPYSGIEVAFRFASPENKRETGPLKRFIKMVSSPGYRPLLNHLSAEYGPIEVMDDLAVQPVTLTAQNGEKFSYLFSLPKKASGPYNGCWMTNWVSRLEPQKKAEEPILQI